MPAAPPVVQATWRGTAEDYLAPLLVVTRDPQNPAQVIERLYYTPARDLTDTEWRALDPAQRRYVAGNRLYTVAPGA